MKRFLLNRVFDATGVSGAGIVACGVLYLNGKVSLTWLTEFTSVVTYDSMEAVEAIHGHGGSTLIVWIDEAFTPNQGQVLDSRLAPLD